MMPEADATTLRGLRYIKHSFQKARQLSRKKGKYSRSTSLHKLDNCNEWILRLGLAEFERKKGISNLNKLIQKLEEHIDKDSLENRGRICDLRNKRNSIQHEMDIPDVRTCKEFVEPTKEFLSEVSKEVWDISFEELRLADLIENDRLKKKISSSEEELENKNYSKAIGGCIESITYLTYGGSEETEWNGLIEDAGKMTRVFSGVDPFKEIDNFETENEEIKELKEAIKESLLKLGQSVTTSQFFTPIQKIKFTRLISEADVKKDYTREDAEKTLDFTVDFILKIQEEGLLPTS